MIIKPFHKYIVLCSKGNKTYRWYLNLEPQYKAWKIVNKHIQLGDNIKGYKIISMEEQPLGINVKLEELPWESDFSKESLNFWNKPIHKDEFDFYVNTSGIDFAVSPSYSQSYRCQICGGVVANNVCTECMFDWDS